jgi:hypothetical protein
VNVPKFETLILIKVKFARAGIERLLAKGSHRGGVGIGEPSRCFLLYVISEGVAVSDLVASLNLLDPFPRLLC